MDLDDPLELAALLSSRLCHDLVSPVGAVCNGVELISAAATPDPADVALLEESARAAADALAFFRVAFGAAAPGGAPMSLREIGALARAHLGGARVTLGWPPDDAAVPREIARALLLMLLAAAKAAPTGGRLSLREVEERPLRLTVGMEGRRCALSPLAAALLNGAAPPEPPTPREAHLVYLAFAARRLDAALVVDVGEDRVALTLAAREQRSA